MSFRLQHQVRHYNYIIIQDIFIEDVSFFYLSNSNVNFTIIYQMISVFFLLLYLFHSIYLFFYFIEINLFDCRPINLMNIFHLFIILLLQILLLCFFLYSIIRQECLKIYQANLHNTSNFLQLFFVVFLYLLHYLVFLYLYLLHYLVYLYLLQHFIFLYLLHVLFLLLFHVLLLLLFFFNNLQYKPIYFLIYFQHMLYAIYFFSIDPFK